MMEFNAISTIAHHIEDVFFYIREKGIESLNAEHKKELFNLMFQSEDYLRSEIEKVEQCLPLSEDIDASQGRSMPFWKRSATRMPLKARLHQQLKLPMNRKAAGKPYLVSLMIPRLYVSSTSFWKKALAWKTCGHL